MPYSKNSTLVAGAALSFAAALLVGGAASAAVALDPAGDFYSRYAGPRAEQLDIRSLSVTLQGTGEDAVYVLTATVNGSFDRYEDLPRWNMTWTVDRNLGPDVEQTIARDADTEHAYLGDFEIQMSGTGPQGRPSVLFTDLTAPQVGPLAAIGGEAIAMPPVFAGDTVTLVFPENGLARTAAGPIPDFDPLSVRFGAFTLESVPTRERFEIADFGPDGLTAATSAAAPEPSAWALAVIGFGLAGAALRADRRLAASTGRAG